MLEIRLVVNEKPHWCMIYPHTIWKTVVWATVGLSQAGINPTVAYLQLALAWKDGRSTKSIEVLQRLSGNQAKGNKASGNRQHLYAERPWQKVAIDLVSPLLQTRQDNQWILVLSDHPMAGCTTHPRCNHLDSSYYPRWKRILLFWTTGPDAHRTIQPSVKRSGEEKKLSAGR